MKRPEMMHKIESDMESLTDEDIDNLTADEAEESGDVCGGIMDIFVERWNPSESTGPSDA